MSDTGQRIAILGGARTPFVRANSVYSKIPASTLGGAAIREAVARSGVDPAALEEIFFGIVSSPSEGTNVAREALFDSGLPATIPCTTINRYCASSMETAASLGAKIQSGQISAGIAGGVESISSIRALFSQEATDFFSKLGRAKGPGQALPMLTRFKMRYLAPHAPGIKEPTTGLSMGQSADLMAREYGVPRDEQDRYALASHKKAHAAWERGFYRSHVAPMATPAGQVIDRDTDIRADSTIEKMGTLRPVFYKDGSITAANASPLTDGASAVVLASESRARELGIQPLGYLRGYATSAIDLKKEALLIGPVFAFPRALKSAGVTFKDIDLFEVHEAFAAQVLSTLRALGSRQWAQDKMGLDSAIGEIPEDRLNVNGGSIPIGHPFGATGGRLILQTLHELRARKKSLGLISVCAAGGLGSVMVVEAAGS